MKLVCQKKGANKKNAPGPFIHCRGKTPGTNRLMWCVMLSSVEYDKHDKCAAEETHRVFDDTEVRKVDIDMQAKLGVIKANGHSVIELLIIARS